MVLPLSFIMWVFTGDCKPKDYSKVISILEELKKKYIYTYEEPGIVNKGLCHVLCKMYDEYNINNKEYYLIKDILYSHRPKSNKKYGNFWWDVSDMNSRIEFLDNLIEKYSNNLSNGQ